MGMNIPIICPISIKRSLGRRKAKQNQLVWGFGLKSCVMARNNGIVQCFRGHFCDIVVLSRD